MLDGGVVGRGGAWCCATTLAVPSPRHCKDEPWRDKRAPQRPRIACGGNGGGMVWMVVW